MNFKQLRKSHCTQAEFAKKINVKASTVSKWETGKNCPRPSVAKKIAKMLNVTIDEIYKSIEECKKEVSKCQK